GERRGVAKQARSVAPMKGARLRSGTRETPARGQASARLRPRALSPVCARASARASMPARAGAWAAVLLATLLGPLAVSPARAEFRPDRILVKYRANASKTARARTCAALPAHAIDDLTLIDGQVLALDGISVAEALDRARHDPA